MRTVKFPGIIKKTVMKVTAEGEFELQVDVRVPSAYAAEAQIQLAQSKLQEEGVMFELTPSQLEIGKD